MVDVDIAFGHRGKAVLLDLAKQVAAEAGQVVVAIGVLQVFDLGLKHIGEAGAQHVVGSQALLR